ncbi:hypothetical protein [Nocardioides sp. NPDC047086]|uniref:hypothetical protein n=1 Tax=Nocardioides sp. NPDC047086 TaxID=3154810 RepID=UPI0033F33644
MAMNRLRGKVIRKAGSAAELDEARAVIDELRAITDRQRVRIGDLERELARVSPQVAALEARVETLRDAVERGSIATGAPSEGHVDAASIWAEIQRQQEQVRARITAATRFEERLRRLEDGAT